ncbi:MAG: SDR family NAD(P)-dependent oxidoreductase [Flavobacteriales bacterium]|nr:SDR family NAD(P)-dependent oxidoreductase [Flavobacteriales bacterium]
MGATGRNSPVLVTGGAGFIGSHVCEALLAAGAQVRCLDNLATGNEANIAHLRPREDFRFIKADICDAADVHAAMKGADAIVHLAALGSVPRSIARPLDSEQANLAGFLQVLEAARALGLKRLVYASSSSVYGDSAVLPKREGTEGGLLSPYAVTKAMDETYAGLYARMFGMEAIGLRFFNIFGERQDPEGAYAAAIPKFIRALLRHEAPLLHGDGLQTRDFTYVGNAVQAVMLALAAPPHRAGEVYNIACGARCDLRELLAKLQQRLARLDPRVASMAPSHGPDRPGDVRDSLADIGHARRQLGYEPLIGLDAGLDKAVPWYAEHWR